MVLDEDIDLMFEEIENKDKKTLNDVIVILCEDINDGAKLLKKEKKINFNNSVDRGKIIMSVETFYKCNLSNLIIKQECTRNFFNKNGVDKLIYGLRGTIRNELKLSNYENNNQKEFSENQLILIDRILETIKIKNDYSQFLSNIFIPIENCNDFLYITSEIEIPKYAEKKKIAEFLEIKYSESSQLKHLNRNILSYMKRIQEYIILIPKTHRSGEIFVNGLEKAIVKLNKLL